MPLHRSNIKRNFAEEKHREIRAAAGYNLEHYAEIMADAFASALEDGYTATELRIAVNEQLNEWGVIYETD
jgi:hypothetical protein